MWPFFWGDIVARRIFSISFDCQSRTKTYRVPASALWIAIVKHSWQAEVGEAQSRGVFPPLCTSNVRRSVAEKCSVRAEQLRRGRWKESFFSLPFFPAHVWTAFAASHLLLGPERCGFRSRHAGWEGPPRHHRFGWFPENNLTRSSAVPARWHLHCVPGPCSFGGRRCQPLPIYCAFHAQPSAVDLIWYGVCVCVECVFMRRFHSLPTPPAIIVLRVI